MIYIIRRTDSGSIAYVEAESKDEALNRLLKKHAPRGEQYIPKEVQIVRAPVEGEFMLVSTYHYVEPELGYYTLGPAKR